MRTVQIPTFEFYFSKDKKTIHYRYTNCINGFDLPLVLENNDTQLKIFPSQDWNSKNISQDESELFDPIQIEKFYYINAREISNSQTAGLNNTH